MCNSVNLSQILQTDSKEGFIHFNAYQDKRNPKSLFELITMRLAFVFHFNKRDFRFLWNQTELKSNYIRFGWWNSIRSKIERKGNALTVDKRSRALSNASTVSLSFSFSLQASVVIAWVKYWWRNWLVGSFIVSLIMKPLSTPATTVISCLPFSSHGFFILLHDCDEFRSHENGFKPAQRNCDSKVCIFIPD